MYINKVFLLGEISTEPQIKVFKDNNFIIILNVTTKLYKTNKSTTKLEELTNWHRVILQNEIAINFKEKLKKNDFLLITGRIITRRWISQSKYNYITEIIAEEIKEINFIKKFNESYYNNNNLDETLNYYNNKQDNSYNSLLYQNQKSDSEDSNWNESEEGEEDNYESYKNNIKDENFFNKETKNKKNDLKKNDTENIKKEEKNKKYNFNEELFWSDTQEENENYIKIDKSKLNDENYLLENNNLKINEKID